MQGKTEPTDQRTYSVASFFFLAVIIAVNSCSLHDILWKTSVCGACISLDNLSKFHKFYGFFSSGISLYFEWMVMAYHNNRDNNYPKNKEYYFVLCLYFTIKNLIWTSILYFLSLQQTKLSILQLVKQGAKAVFTWKIKSGPSETKLEKLQKS